MKRTLSILSLILIFNIAKANTIADTIPKGRTVKKAIPVKTNKPVWGKPKVLNAKDDAARRKAEEVSFRPVRKHYFNPNKPI